MIREVDLEVRIVIREVVLEDKMVIREVVLKIRMMITVTVLKFRMSTIEVVQFQNMYDIYIYIQKKISTLHYRKYANTFK